MSRQDIEPLLKAAAAGSNERVVALIAHYKNEGIELYREQYHKNHSALILIAGYCSASTLELYISSCIEQFVALKEQQLAKANAIYPTIFGYKGRCAFRKKLFEAVSQDKIKASALHFAVSGEIDVLDKVKLFVRFGADISVSDVWNRNIAHHAALTSGLPADFFEHLIQCYAQLFSVETTENATPRQLAENNKNKAMLAALDAAPKDLVFSI